MNAYLTHVGMTSWVSGCPVLTVSPIFLWPKKSKDPANGIQEKCFSIHQLYHSINPDQRGIIHVQWQGDPDDVFHPLLTEES